MKVAHSRLLGTSARQFVGGLAACVLSLAIATDSFAALQHNYLFNSGNGNQIIDSQSGANGSVLNIDDDPVNGVVPADSRFVLGNNNYGNLPGATIGINSYSELTFEMWATVSAVHANQYTASVAFGNTVAGLGSQYVMMQPTRGGAAGSSGNFLDTAGGAELVIAGPNDLSDGRLHHTVTTITATDMAYYVDGVLIGTQPVGARSLANVATNFAYLGRSVWAGDPRLQGAIYEFRIYDDARSAEDVAGLFAAGCTAGCGDLYLEVDRGTGIATLINELSSKDVIAYELSSASGALDPTNWNNFDPGWQEASATRTLLSEQDPTFTGVAFGATPFELGPVWTPSPFEDLQFTLSTVDESFNIVDLSVPVFFVGNNDLSFHRSDFNLDNETNEMDYFIFRANHLQNLGGELPIDTFALGDLDGDLDNDYQDFRLFKADFIAANSEMAFAAMIAGLGTVPEPGTFGLLMLGAAACVLTNRRRRADAGAPNSSLTTCHISENRCIMNRVTKTLLPILLLMVIPNVSRAQTVVGAQDFDAAPLGDFLTSGIPGARYYTFQALNPFAEIVTPGLGGSGNSLRTEVDYLTGQFNVGGAGFQMPLTGNISPNRVDYNLEFDIRMIQGEPYLPDTSWVFSVGIMSNATFAQQGGSNYHLSMTEQNISELEALTPGGDWQHVVLNLGNPNELFFNETMHWNPVDPSNQVAFEFNSIRTPPADVTQILEIDNIQLVLDIAPSLALVVDPTSGRARLRNVSDGDITFDYYVVESTNGSLLTADFNGTTGWDSLADQGIDSTGPEVGESWDEIAELNSSGLLSEWFVIGDTTLSPGQSVSLGAPINPAILNNQLESLSLRLGGPSYDSPTFGSVMFADLSALAGDYNGDGRVDAGDYVRWRNALAGNGTIDNETVSPGVVDLEDYTEWRNNYGNPGSGSGGLTASIPEPASVALVFMAFCMVGFRGRLGSIVTKE